MSRTLGSQCEPKERMVSSAPDTHHNDVHPMIKVDNLVRSFGDFQAVKNISFEVKPGEVFAFLGPNGAGTTTTIKMMTTLLSPTSGTIRVDGLDPAKHQHQVRRLFGIVFQDPSLDSELTA